MLSFSNKKQLRFIITLGDSKFAGDNDTVTLQGFRASVHVDKAGGIQMSTLRARIYGISAADMTRLASFNWKIGLWQPNKIQVFAIDGTVETQVFAGNIVNAWADYQNMPDVFLHVQARLGERAALAAVPPRSFKGGVDVASVMSQIARDAGFTFENNGVDVKLSDIYLSNTALEQIKDLAKWAGIDYYLDDGVLAICPKNVPRGGLVPSISRDTGLVGYPTFDGFGLNFQTLFNPAVTFGGKVAVVSDVPQANGQWFVSSVAHMLDSEKPDGAWYSQIRALPNEFSVDKR